jgi:hypothetical protein
VITKTFLVFIKTYGFHRPQMKRLPAPVLLLTLVSLRTSQPQSSQHQHQHQQHQQDGANSCDASTDGGGACLTEETVPRATGELPGDDPAAWARLLASPTPLIFRASPETPRAELLSATRSWSWERIGKGLGPHVRGFVGQPGDHGFPYYEGNMPLDGVAASRGLSRRAEPIMASGEEIVSRIRAPLPGSGSSGSSSSGVGPRPRLSYASQSLLQLKGGAVDERVTARGPMPPLGRDLFGALRQIGAGASSGLASAALWMGSAGSVTPLHYDTSHNVYVQLHGAKRLQLLPPSAAAKAHLYPSLHPGYRQSLLDISAPALAGPAGKQGAAAAGHAKPTAAALKLAASALVVTMQPGDTLILPPYWLHSVEALGSNATAADGYADGDGGAAAAGTGGVASVACWFTAEAFLSTEQIYSVRVPFNSAWDVSQRTTAVFAFLRTVGREYDQQQRHREQQRRRRRRETEGGSQKEEEQEKEEEAAGRGAEWPQRLALLPALRSRYTQLYRDAFARTKKQQQQQGLLTSLPEGEGVEAMLCGSLSPAQLSHSESNAAVTSAKDRSLSADSQAIKAGVEAEAEEEEEEVKTLQKTAGLFVGTGMGEHAVMVERAQEVAGLLGQQTPSSVAALNFANFGAYVCCACRVFFGTESPSVCDVQSGGEERGAVMPA